MLLCAAPPPVLSIAMLDAPVMATLGIAEGTGTPVPKSANAGSAEISE